MQSYKHQLEGTAHILRQPHSAILAEPGTGKTRMALKAIEEHQPPIALVLCPVSVRLNWLEEVQKHTPGLKAYLLDTPANRKKAFAAECPKILIGGIESLSSGSLFPELTKYFRANALLAGMMVVDESHLIKNHASIRTKRATALGQLFEKRVIMTGTPSTGKLADLFAQFRFVDGVLGTSFGKFRNYFCIMGGFEGRQIVGYRAVDEMMQLIEPYSFRALKKDCLDLPEKVYEVRHVKMAPEQKKAYREAYDDLMVEIGSEQFGVQNALERLLRCQQITAGILKSGDNQIDLPTPKIAEAMNFIEEVEGSVVIWTSHRRELERMVAALETQYPGETVMVHGDVKNSDRQDAINAFQAGKARFYVATQAASGIGVTLTAASTEIFLSNTFSATQRIQAEDRLHRVSQKSSVTVVDIVCEGTIDNLILGALRNKQDVINAIMENNCG